MTQEGEAPVPPTIPPSSSLADRRRAALHAALGLGATFAVDALGQSEVYDDDGLPA